MADQSINPFLSLAKSNDLTNEQISDLWVGFDVSPNGHPLFDPTSPMATVVLGGKGSGKTHLFRYYSYPVQTKLYGSGDWLASILKDRYIGIYTRAAGLNCGRLQGKDIDPQRWKEVFRYYMELWLGQEFLDVASKLLYHVNAVAEREQEIVSAFTKYINMPAGSDVSTISDFSDFLRTCQRLLDRDINQAAFTRRIDPDIRCSPGDLVFGLPKTLAGYLTESSSLVFVYYIDECENLLEYQQQHVNTLLRDRRRPVTFRIGARSYGMRTYKTDSGEGEEIQEDSEYQLLRLDERMRREEKRYRKFARQLLARRVAVPESVLTMADMDECFPLLPRKSQRFKDMEYPPHMDRLTRQLSEVPSIQAEEIVSNLRVDEDLVAEKAAVYMFYQVVANGMIDLPIEAKKIGHLVKDHQDGIPNDLTSKIDHYRGDFIAQISRDFRQGRSSSEDNHYTGLDNFIFMSEGLPRSLLTIAGESVKSAVFRSELPNSSHPISAESQYDGVRYASDWFFSDVPQGGELGESIQLGISRLGELFRMNRFADKPIECSLISFSVCMETASRRAREIILEAERRSFLIKAASPQNDRAGNSVWDKFHMNRILCPRFDLPLSRRGAVRLDSDEVEAIFGSSEKHLFEEVKGRWKRRLDWPFGRKDFGSDRLF